MCRLIVTPIVLLSLASTAALAQSGGFLVKLGTDTIAVEQFSRSAGQIHGLVVRRLPSTLVVRYKMTLNADGSIASFEQSAGRSDGSTPPNVPPGGRMTFTADSVMREIQSGAPRTTLDAVAPKGTVPGIGLSWLSYQLQLEAARRHGAAYTMSFVPTQQAPTKVDVRFIDPDSAEIVVQGFRMGFKMDANGRLVRSDGTLTTQKFLIARDSDIDALSIARAWEVRDSNGGAIGVASPRDTARATVDGADIVIDYGRPAKRGRAIWGALVPYDTTWRFGANAATQFRTSKDIDIGGTTVRAGFYTLWLYPTVERAWLIVNSQTGQWGTAYDSTKNVARIPLETIGSLETPEERFRIFIEGDSLKMLWDRSGYSVKLGRGT